MLDRIYEEAFNGLASLGGVGIILALSMMLVLFFSLPVPLRSRVRVSVVLFCTYLVFVLIAALVPQSWAGYQRIQVAALALLLTCLGRTIFVISIDAVLEHRFSKPLPKIFRDLIQSLTYAAVFFFTLSAAGVEPGSLLTTSALLTAVIGLSLQETLGNMFAGLALQAQQPFGLGDWIQIESDQHLTGKVIEVNWRSTKILTDEQLTIVIPNGLLAKSSIRNYSKPSKAVRRSVRVSCPYDVPPGDVRIAILEALEDLPLVLKRPIPEIITEEFADSGITYWVRYYTNSFGDRFTVDGAVRDRIWYALQRASITIPYPTRVSYVHGVDDTFQAKAQAGKVRDHIAALKKVDIFRELSDLDFAELAEKMQTRYFGMGENIFNENDSGDELFIIVRGRVSVKVQRGDGIQTPVAELLEGNFFGEMSLMTGENRTASVHALEETELSVVCSKFFKTILNRRPELVERISEALAQRQAVLQVESVITPADQLDGMNVKKADVLARIKGFFALR